MGQVLLSHLGGGQGGMEHFLQQFTGPMTAWWKVLGTPLRFLMQDPAGHADIFKI
jgi:hypothetical protein